MSPVCVILLSLDARFHRPLCYPLSTYIHTHLYTYTYISTYIGILSQPASTLQFLYDSLNAHQWPLLFCLTARLSIGARSLANSFESECNRKTRRCSGKPRNFAISEARKVARKVDRTNPLSRSLSLSVALFTSCGCTRRRPPPALIGCSRRLYANAIRQSRTNSLARRQPGSVLELIRNALTRAFCRVKHEQMPWGHAILKTCIKIMMLYWLSIS